jgi:hypothetical protein
MTLDELLETGAQAGNIQFAAQPDRAHELVRRVVRVDLLKNPQTPLPE